MAPPKSGESTSPGDAFDLRRIRRLIELMDAHGLTEVEIRQGDMRIRLRRRPTGEIRVVPPVGESATARPAPTSLTPPAPTAEAETTRYVEIKSPMVGTFYAASSPDAEPYVRVGSHVEPENIVCIIEAMKVFNEIPAEVRGTIVAVLVENGEPVEYGQPLFRVDPSQ